MSEEEEIDYNYEELTTDISNLTSSLTNLCEVDAKLLSKGRQSKLARMKRQIFDALVYYCECLPQLIEDEKEDQED